jgi:hypothetical protein
MQLFDWLLCYLLKSSHQKLFQNLKDGKDLFTARNENQIFYSKTLALVFMEVFIFILVYLEYLDNVILLKIN